VLLFETQMHETLSNRDRDRYGERGLLSGRIG